MIERARRRKARKGAASWYARMAEPGSAEEVAAFEAWLARDPSHARAYAEIDAVARAAQGVRVGQIETGRPPWKALRPALAFALVALALVTAVVFSQGTGTPAFAAISNTGDAVRAVRLTDGTVVWLDVGARLGVRIDAGHREIAVREGRVRIVPAADPRVLIVSAGDVQVHPGTTTFDARAVGNRITVAALNGPLSLSAPAHAANVPDLRVASGRALALEAGVTRPVALDRTWPAARLRFDAVPLSRILALANRVGDPELVAADAGIGALRVSGVFDLRDTRRLARKLGATLDLWIDEQDGRLVLRR